jgi:hypothetical protein
MPNKTFFLFLFVLVFFSCKQELPATHFPTVDSTTKPWTRWWWLGNAVEESSIDATLEAFANAGLGGVEIATIYGAKGAEDKFIDHLSPEWIEKVNHTLKTAKRLGLGVDLTLGTGWPFGGPQVEVEYAATKLHYEMIEVKQGKALDHSVELRNEKINAPLKCVAAVAFDSQGEALDLTKAIQNKRLMRAAQDNAYKLYLVYADKTAQKVKRASPGGEGWTLDHFSTDALNDYLEPYNLAFTTLNNSIRGVFNDSYEVYGTDFSPNFFDRFKQKRGYDLKPYLGDLLNEASDSIGNRIKADYRLTLSDMLLEDFNVPWNEWAHSKKLKTRLQAHGSPGNLIDLYASADIPECETFGSMPYSIEGFRRLEENIRKGDADPAMLRFSSSAAHISGKSLVSAESFTWIREHFKTALSQCKPEVEDLFLNGVNHVFLHGSTYSPTEVYWPGWKFYAAVNFHPSNPIWEDVAALFHYITTVQSFLQAGTPDNDVLIYWPFHDITNSFLEGKRMQQLAIHDLDTWLTPTPFYKAIQWLLRQGYGFDYLSDQFLEKITVENGTLILPGGHYKALIIPKTKHLPMASLEKLVALKKSGANIIFEDLPQTIPGFKNFREETTKMQAVVASNKLTKTPLEAWDSTLIKSGAKPEKWVKSGLKFIRRKWENETVYFLVNHTSKTIQEWLPLGVQSEKVVIFDPLNTLEGLAQTKTIEGILHTKVEIKSGNSLLLRTDSKSTLTPWEYYEPLASSISLNGTWNLHFIHGGPQLPKPVKLDSLVSWTELGFDYQNFSGTGVYEHQFTIGETPADAWLLELKNLRESAKIWLDGNFIGSLWANPYEIQLPKMKQGQHTLKIQVSNLGANRIRAKERRGEEWKNFYEINMVNKDYQNFDATQWDLTPSGLLMTPKIIPLKKTISK